MLPGWTFELLADGIAIYPPEGKKVGAIRVKERVRPLATIAAIFEPEIAEASQRLDNLELHSLERFTTAQGEFAAIGVISGTIKNKPEHRLERTIAIVYGDDFYQRYDAIVQDPELFEKVRMATREFAFRSSLGLGELRFRRFMYEPPEGWQPLVRAMTTEWYPPGYPADRCRITAPPARHGIDVTVFDEVLVLYQEPGFHEEQKSGPHPITSDHGLHGFVLGHRGVLPDGRRMVYEQALFKDTRFVYLLRFESDEERYEEHHEIFKKVVLSVEPLPSPRSIVEPDDFVHWAT